MAITHEQLLDILDYNRSTGVFTWARSNSGGTVQIGGLAGSLDTKGYHIIQLYGRTYKAHRLAWLYVHGSFPGMLIDHIDHNRSNNAISNLREVTYAENSKNIQLTKRNTSGVLGVTYRKSRGIWEAQIKVDGVSKYLGSFNTLEEASTARKIAETLYGFHANHGRLF